MANISNAPPLPHPPNPSKVTPDDLPWYKLFACFLSAVHMSEEMRINHPEFRNRWFEEGGRTGECLDEMLELRRLLDYAEWAYDDDYLVLKENLAKSSFTLLRQDLVTEPGRVGHFIALNREDDTALICLKGTSTISDLLTDLLGKSIEHVLDAPFDEEYGLRPIRVHEGIFAAASKLADDVQDLITDLFLPRGYKILICGHSLGAGSACLLGLLLRSRIPALREGGGGDAPLLRVVAFASPPVLNYDAALACAPFVTTVVNDTDVIPRASLRNAIVLNKFLLEIVRKLDEAGLSPNSLRAARDLSNDLLTYDERTLMSCEELNEFTQRCDREEDKSSGDDLFVPGRVIALYEKKTAGEAVDGDDVPVKDVERINFGAVVADGGLRGLRQIEIRTEMITDHFCTGYREAIDSFIG